jgi:hypothetical protein
MSKYCIFNHFFKLLDRGIVVVFCKGKIILRAKVSSFLNEPQLRSAAERQAVNTRVQGSASDLVKVTSVFILLIALCQISEALK